MKITASALLAIVAAAMPTAFSVSDRDSTVRSFTGSRERAPSSTSSVSRAVRSHVNDAARSRAAAPSRSRSPGSSTTRCTAATSPASSSASSPVSPSTIDSASPPTRSATLGVPHVAASITVRHQPSAELAVRFTHACAYSCSLQRLADVPVQHDPVAEPAARDLGLQLRPVVALTRDVQDGAGDRLHGVQQQLDPLVLLQPPEIQQPRRLRARGQLLVEPDHAQVPDVHVLGAECPAR